MKTNKRYGMLLFGLGVLALCCPTAPAAGQSAQRTVAATSVQTAPDVTPVHHTTQVNGILLHYVTAGKGEPLVLLHGFGETWYEWRDLIPELAAHYTVIMPDLRGAGDSERPIAGYDKKTMAADVHALVQQLGYKSINLVGHDIGLMVAYAYAAGYRTEVRRLALLDAPIPGVGDWEQLQRDPHVWHFSFHSVSDLPEALVAGRERTYLTTGFYFPKAYNPAAFTEDRIAEYVRHYAAPGGMRAGFSYFRAFPDDIKQNQEYARTKLKMPVLALGGAQSYGAAIVPLMQTVAENVSGGAIEECGHWIPVEKPQELTRRFLAFFGDGK